MLDTGIDVPEAVNLVFMKPVQSPIKLQQMIGRGTRVQAACRNLALLPNFEKKDFLIIDFWENNFSRDAKEAVPVARIGDILSNGEVNPNLENYVRIPSEINKRFPRTILELGDILMAVRGDGSTGKRIGMVKSKNLVGSNISPNLLRFKAKEKYVSSSYLFTFMTSNGGQELIDRYITRTAKKTITSADIQTIKIPVPPLNLQEEFAGVVARVDGLRARMSEAGRQVEGLFESLLSESFGGG